MTSRSSRSSSPAPQSSVFAATAAAGVMGSVDDPWDLWHARGAAHDRAVRSRMMLAGPPLLIAAAMIFSMLLR